MMDDVPEFPPSEYMDRMAASSRRRDPELLPTLVAFDEIRVEGRIVGPKLVLVAHHYYNNGKRVVEGAWVEMETSAIGGLTLHDMQGFVKCRA